VIPSEENGNRFDLGRERSSNRRKRRRSLDRSLRSIFVQHCRRRRRRRPSHHRRPRLLLRHRRSSYLSNLVHFLSLFLSPISIFAFQKLTVLLTAGEFTKLNLSLSSCSNSPLRKSFHAWDSDSRSPTRSAPSLSSAKMRLLSSSPLFFISANVNNSC